MAACDPIADLPLLLGRNLKLLQEALCSRALSDVEDQHVLQIDSGMKSNGRDEPQSLCEWYIAMPRRHDEPVVWYDAPVELSDIHIVSVVVP